MQIFWPVFISENANAINKSKTEKGEVAYAKLVGENGREFYIKENSNLQIDIGREKKEGDLNYFNLSDSNTLSKKHAHIFWDYD